MSQTHGLVPAASTAPATRPGSAERELLQSVVETARAIFGAAASSVLLHDEAAGELVFQAVSGEGEEFLVGSRFPAGRGLAGWVLVSGEPMVADDLREQGMFAKDVAEDTGYVPDALMAAPLAHHDRVLGVLEVLDPAEQSRSSLSELDLLALFARQAAAALAVVTERREEPAPAAVRARSLELVSALRDVLEGAPPRG
ncbi:GAF domain-containing protein [Streptomyces sp. Z26]|uniref:GAF domain-containing protein n=1 Tax=Streptomyces sp. Z26 TaxID=2500177 RepID=UPI000EF130CC|nr:GAF domain-containing protein [Streptomyces sp. Z26]RLL69326.1 GAF domain-containing protein [Streptomyces sp. Z26]